MSNSEKGISDMSVFEAAGKAERKNAHEDKAVRMTISLPPSAAEFVKNLASNENTSTSAVILSAIRHQARDIVDEVLLKAMSEQASKSSE